MIVFASIAPGGLETIGWSFDPITILLTLVIVGAYGLRSHRLRLRGRAPGRWRQLSFYLGVVVLLLALLSPIDSLAESRLFYAHMIQHLAIGELAPLLILVGLSGAMLRPILALPGMVRFRWLLNPLIALPIWAVNLYLWHLPALYEAALDHELVHVAEHACFFWAGILMWGALLEPMPGPSWFNSGAKVAYVVTVRALGCGILGNALIWIGTPLYPFYRPGEHVSHISPLADQQLGGAIMFVWGAFLTIVLFSWFFLRWVRETELRQSLLDRGANPREAIRASRYGRRRADPAPPPPSP